MRDTLGNRRNADEVKVAKEPAVTDEFTFTLVNCDLNGGLTVSSREDLEYLGSATVDELGHGSTESFGTKGQRRNIEKKGIRDIAGENTASNGSTSSDSLVRVHTLAGLATHGALESLTDLGHTDHTTEEAYLVGFFSLDVSITDRAPDERLAEGLELRAHQLRAEKHQR